MRSSRSPQVRLMNLGEGERWSILTPEPFFTRWLESGYSDDFCCRHHHPQDIWQCRETVLWSQLRDGELLASSE